jgi:hypothetical protein
MFYFEIIIAVSLTTGYLAIIEIQDKNNHSLYKTLHTSPSQVAEFN